jgi:hypothetical protein
MSQAPQRLCSMKLVKGTNKQKIIAAFLLRDNATSVLYLLAMGQLMNLCWV